MSSSPPLNGRTLSRVTPSWFCLVNHLWTDMSSDLFRFMVLKLSCPVCHLWTDEFITLFSFSLLGLWILTVKLTLWPMNSELWAWCLLVGHIQPIISEPTGVQIQFTLAVSNGLAVILWQQIQNLSHLSLSRPVHHLWIDGFLKSSSPFVYFYV